MSKENYFVIYNNKDTDKLAHIEVYQKDKWGGYSHSDTDIESYAYGYTAKQLEIEEGQNIINEGILKHLETIALQQRIIELMAKDISLRIAPANFKDLEGLKKIILTDYTKKAKEETNA